MQQFLMHDDPALIWTGDLVLEARLTVPSAAPGLILMPGLGGTFLYDGIRALAMHFHHNGFATLIADILTPDEQQFDARTRHFRSDIVLLSQRVAAVVSWLQKEEATRELPQALYAGGAVGSAALLAIANGAADFFAATIVCPRIGVVHGLISGVRTPSLLLIDEISDVPHVAFDGEMRIERVAAVTPLLESQPAMEEVARKSLTWFRNRLPAPARAPAPASTRSQEAVSSR